MTESTDESRASRHPERRGRKTSRVWRDRIIAVVVVWAAWALITTFVIQPFKIPSGSMEKTLGIGDRVLVSKWVDGGDVKRGDVVVFSDPGDWADEQSSSGGVSGGLRKVLEWTHLSASGAHLVKRVIGLPGDRVQCDGPASKLEVNGVTIDEPYVDHPSAPCAEAAGAVRFTIVVPAGHMWVMGDHRDNSDDSREHDMHGNGQLGSVPLSNVTGRALAVVWPLDRLSGGHNDEGAFAKVPAPSTGK